MSHPSPLPTIKVVGLPSPTIARRQRPQQTVDLRWLKVEEFLNSSSLSVNSRKVYFRELTRFAEWLPLNWSEIKSRHIASYKLFLKEEVQTRSGTPLSQSSINCAIASVKSFFSWLMQSYPELVTHDPCLGVRFEKIPLPPAQNLNAQQVEQVWGVLPQLGETQLRDTALIHILFHGLRAGEVVSLNLAAFDQNILFLADTKNNEPRLVPLLKAAAAAIQAYLNSREELGEEMTGDRPLLLSHHHGHRSERLTYFGLSYAIGKIGDLAGVPDLHPHQFRHTYATELLLKGVDPTHARRLTGHRSDQSFRRYTLAGEQQAAMDAFYRAYEPERVHSD